jgi:hypothetical protein
VPPSGVVFLADAEIEALEWLRGAAHRRGIEPIRRARLNARDGFAALQSIL